MICGNTENIVADIIGGTVAAMHDVSIDLTLLSPPPTCRREKNIGMYFLKILQGWKIFSHSSNIRQQCDEGQRLRYTASSAVHACNQWQPLPACIL